MGSRLLDLSGNAADRDIYTVPAACDNCGQELTLRIAKGQRAPTWTSRAICPTCECRTVTRSR